MSMLRALVVGWLVCLSLSSPALAQSRQWDRSWHQANVLEGNLVEVAVIDRTEGRALEVYPWRGRNYIAGRPGSIYQIQLRNKTSQRIMVVVGVDGINVLSGRNAATNQQGYVLAPYQTATIDGWRKSYSHVAQFNFTSVPESYAGQTGRANQVGVIGVAVFRERYRVIEPSAPVIYEDRGVSQDKAQNSARAEAGVAAPAPQSRTIGTGHGDSQWSPVQSTQFIRASATPDEVLRLDYDRHAVLVRRGIIDRWQDDDEPRAFPNDQFVPDPPSRW